MTHIHTTVTTGNTTRPLESKRTDTPVVTTLASLTSQGQALNEAAIPHSSPLTAMQSPLLRRIARGLSWQTAFALLGRIGTFSVALIQARLLGKAGYGELGMALSTLSLYSIIASAAGGQTCTKFIAQDRELAKLRAERITGLSALLAAALAVFTSAAIVLSSDWVARNAIGSEKLSILLKLAGAAIALQSLAGIASGILLGLQAFKEDAVLRTVQIASWIPLTALLSARFGVKGAMLAYTLSYGIGLFFYIGVTTKVCRANGFMPRLEGSWTEAGVLLSYSLPMILHGMICVPTIWVTNTFLVKHPNGFSELGAYSAATQFRAIVVQMPLLIQAVVWPTMAELHGNNSKDKLRRLYQNSFEVIWALAVCASLPTIAFRDKILSAFGNSFTGDSSLICLVMTTATLSVLAGFTGSALQVLGKTWVALYANIIYSVIVVVLARNFAHDSGATGLALAFVIGTLVQVFSLTAVLGISAPYMFRSFHLVLATITVCFCAAMQLGPSAVRGGTAANLTMLFVLCTAAFSTALYGQISRALQKAGHGKNAHSSDSRLLPS